MNPNQSTGAGNGPSLRIGFLDDHRLFGAGGELYAESAFVRFLLGFRACFDELVFMSRVFPPIPRDQAPYLVGGPGVRIAGLPPYPRLARLCIQPWRYREPIARVLRAELPHLDALWLNFGNPVSTAALWMARGYPNLRCFGMLRGDYEREARLKAPGPSRTAPLVATVAAGMMRASMGIFTTLCRRQRVPCFVYEADLAGRLAAAGLKVHRMVDSLLTQEDIAAPPQPREELEVDVIAVSHLYPLKGVDVLIQAMAGLKSAKGRPARLRVVGSGPSLEELRARANTLGLAEQVFFDGHVPNGPELFVRYASAVLMAVPSRSEGTPKAALEAMAFGCPVVASTVGGLPDLVGRDGERGLLVPPGDPGAMRAALQTLLDDPDRLAKLSLAARQHGGLYTMQRQVRYVVERVLPEICNKM